MVFQAQVFRLWLSFSLCTLCAACGGASKEPRVVQLTPFQEADDRYSELLRTQNSLSINPATAATILGTANYTGVILFSSDQSANSESLARLSGDLDLAIDLSRTENSISGTITNLTQPSGTQFRGSLRVTEGTSDRNASAGKDYSFSASVSGSLIDSNDTDVFGIGGLEGDFLGTQREQIQGISYLQLSTSEGTARLIGRFAAADSQ